MNEELVKNLVNLIDDTIGELDELKKSDSRFDAQKIELGDKDGLAGRDKNGSLGKEDAEKADDDDDEEEKDKKDKEEDKDDNAEKAEGKNSEADPNAGHHKAVAKDDAEKADDMDKDDAEKAEGKNSEADPNAGSHKPVYKGDMGYSEGTIKKSIDESNDLMKSYIDEQVKTVTDKLEKFGELLKEIADAPVARRGQSYRDVAPLKKSADEEGETLSKSDVAGKLFELKKSGTKVDTLDIISVETGTPADLARVVNKYEIK